jgi:hypothetical protein
MIMPLIFLFLLRDTGDIKRGLLSAVPNRLFEPALAVVADVDETLSGYVRGIFLECCALGLTVMVMLTLVGAPLRWAIAIGIFTGATNDGLRRSIAGWPRLCAADRGVPSAAAVRDGGHLRPLGRRGRGRRGVAQEHRLRAHRARWSRPPSSDRGGDRGRGRRHPIRPAGMFLAIPTITVVKVVVASTARNLKAYGVT